ncbi:MAG: hypothetical protein ACT6RX_05565 [Sphingopyxis solisilvae]
MTFIVGWGYLEGVQYERQTNNATEEYAKHTDEKVAKTCVGIAAVERIKCMNEAFEKKREYESNQADLIAQRKSALWAFIMGAAAVIGVGLSAVGVWLVKTTFDETKRTNNIAKENQDLQVKPWLDIELSGRFFEDPVNRFNKGEKEPRIVRIGGSVTIRNFSNSPGLITRVHCHVTGEGTSSNRTPIEMRQPIIVDKPFDVGRVYLRGIAGIDRDMTVTFGIAKLTRHWLDTNFPLNINLIVAAWYQDISGNCYELSQCWSISKAGNAVPVAGQHEYNYDRKIG